MIYLELFLVFLKIGAFTFGGGFAMLPLVQEAVLQKGWIAEETIVDFIAVSESTPGPFAVNIATFVGAETGGVFGAFIATLAVVLPSFIIILIIAKFFAKFSKSFIVSSCMSGLKPCVIGLIGAAIVSLGRTVFFFDGFKLSAFADITFYVPVAIFILCLALAFKKAHPIFIICLSAAIGIIAGYLGLFV